MGNSIRPTKIYAAFSPAQTVSSRSAILGLLRFDTDLTLFDIGGGMMAPKMFLTTMPKRLGGGS